MRCRRLSGRTTSRRAWSAIAAVALASLACAGIALAQATRRAQLVTIEVRLVGASGRDVARYVGPARIANGADRLATLRFGPKVCAGSSTLQIDARPLKGQARSASTSLRLSGGRRNGRPARCPLAGLPRRGLVSVAAEAAINGKSRVRIAARPSTRRGDPYAALYVRDLDVDITQPPTGHIDMRIVARYASGRSYDVRLAADTAG